MEENEFVQQIKLAYPNTSLMNICDKVGKILEVKSKTIYNKMVGRSQFTVEELILVSQKLGISIDAIIHKDSKVNKPYSFYNRGQHYKPRSFTEYVLNLHHFFEPLVKQKDDVESVYVSKELSIFHLFHFPRLLYFKLYMWNKLNWNSIDAEQYDPEEWINNQHTKAAIDLFLMYYSSLEETEIWSPHLFTTVLHQIENAARYDILNKESDKKLIYNDLEKCIQYLGDILHEGKKIDAKQKWSGPIHVYLNNLIVAPEMINIRLGERRLNYLMIDTPNFLESKDQSFCRSMEKFVDNIKDHSFVISNANKLNRDKFLNSIKQEVLDSRKRVLGF